MLPNLISYKKFNTVKLIKNSGIQFMDFGLKLDFDSEDPERQAYWKEHGTGRFIQSSLKPVPPSDDSEDTGVSSKFSWKRLVRDPSDSYYCDPGDIDTPIDESVKAEVKDAVSLFDGEWLPLPFFSKVTRDKAEDHKKTISDNEFNKGPGNWARFRIARITDRADIRRSGYTHLLTIAFDTRIFDSTGVDYKSGIPRDTDIRNGCSFAFACYSCDNEWYLQPGDWVDRWIRYVYESCRLRSSDPNISKRTKIDFDIERGQYNKDYLNLLALIHDETVVPDVKIAENERRSDHKDVIDVNFILDIGNSRTCGIMIEKHPDDPTGFSQHYELEIRDLTRLERVCRK
ncbi:MAG: virulence factor SrfB, partial [Succinivibrionaceae bacterium]|nr:virulence factor SrfB [Succinivibrionaceae bacterium]